MDGRLRGILDWLGGHETQVLVGVLIIVAGGWAFVAIADEVMEGDTQKFDEAIVLAMRDPNDVTKPVGPAWVQEVARDLTAMGGVAVLVLLTGVVTGFLVFSGKYREALFILAATAGGLILSSLLKGLFDRPRPTVVPHLSSVYTSSFPSGHSMMSAVVYMTLGALIAGLVTRNLQRFFCIAAAIMLTGLVGVSRVFMGVHYPTDVLAGWSAGVAWALICWLVFRRLRKRNGVGFTVN